MVVHDFWVVMGHCTGRQVVDGGVFANATSLVDSARVPSFSIDFAGCGETDGYVGDQKEGVGWSTNTLYVIFNL